MFYHCMFLTCVSWFLLCQSTKSLMLAEEDNCQMTYDPPFLSQFANTIILTCNGKTNPSDQPINMNLIDSSVGRLKKAANGKRTKLVLRNINLVLRYPSELEADLQGFILDYLVVENCIIAIIEGEFFTKKFFSEKTNVTIINTQLSSETSNNFNLENARLKSLMISNLMSSRLERNVFKNMLILEMINLEFSEQFVEPVSLFSVRTKRLQITGTSRKQSVTLSNMTVSSLNLRSVTVTTLNHIFGLNTALYSISITDCDIQEPISEAFLSSVTDVTEKIQITRSLIADVPVFPANRDFNLKEIELVECGIESVDFRMFDKIRYLNFLNLTGNKISELGQSWVSTMQGEIISRLRSLSLRNNLLRYIPPIPRDIRLYNPSSQFNVEISGNPLVCDCRNEWLTFENMSATFLNDNPKCASPPELKNVLLEAVQDRLQCRSSTFTKQTTITRPETSTVPLIIMKGTTPAAESSKEANSKTGGSGGIELLGLLIAGIVIVVVVLSVFLIYKFRDRLFNRTSSNKGKYRVHHCQDNPVMQLNGYHIVSHKEDGSNGVERTPMVRTDESLYPPRAAV